MSKYKNALGKIKLHDTTKDGWYNLMDNEPECLYEIVEEACEKAEKYDEKEQANQELKDIYKSVNRTVTLPKWLNNKAVESGINVSSVLQKALIEILNVEEPSNSSVLQKALIEILNVEEPSK